MNALTTIERADQRNLSLEIPPGTTFEDWLEIGRRLKAMKDQAEHRSTQVNWWIGDWWAFGEHGYGDRSKAAGEGIFGQKSIGHLINIGVVARRFATPCRHGVLSFTHYQEASRLPDSDRQQVIQKAMDEGMSAREVRVEVVKRRTTLGEFRPRPYDGDQEYAEVVAIAQRWNRAELGARGTILDLLEEMGVVQRIAGANLDQEIEP